MTSIVYKHTHIIKMSVIINIESSFSAVENCFCEHSPIYPFQLLKSCFIDKMAPAHFIDFLPSVLLLLPPMCVTR